MHFCYESQRTLKSEPLTFDELNRSAFGDFTGLRVSYAIGTQQVEDGLERMKRLFDNIV